MGIDRCRWVRPRLPLLAGGELGVQERRRVERHLIGCPACRGLGEAARGALSALRSVAQEPAARADAPSLWPALARQIRESRHVAPRPAFGNLAWPRLGSGLWPALGLAMGLGGVMATTMAPVRDQSRPGSLVTVEPVEMVPVVPEMTAPPPRGALPDGPIQSADSRSPAGADPFAPPSSLRFDYDLDRGTPIGPGDRDPQRSY